MVTYSEDMLKLVTIIGEDRNSENVHERGPDWCRKKLVLLNGMARVGSFSPEFLGGLFFKNIKSALEREAVEPEKEAVFLQMAQTHA